MKHKISHTSHPYFVFESHEAQNNPYFASVFYIWKSKWSIQTIEYDIHNKMELGYVRSHSNQKIGSKGSRTVDFASKFETTIESANLISWGMLKVRFLMQNRWLAHPSDQFLGLKGCERTPLPNKISLKIKLYIYIYIYIY
jgi:hypothetical protein